MSPEYNYWLNVDRKTRENVRFFIEDNELGDLNQFVMDGIGFVVVDEQIKRVCPYLSLTEAQKKDARKQSSPWHVVLPMHNSSMQDSILVLSDDDTIEDAKFRRGHSERRYRGNKRSRHKGKGYFAYIENQSRSTIRPR